MAIDIRLYQGEPNPNDVVLRAGSISGLLANIAMTMPIFAFLAYGEQLKAIGNKRFYSWWQKNIT